ncbi:hypothetical protein ES676_00360 [Bizionia saleffrena]|uniref:Exostosin family protein n=1 Tax=Bizionia saleffrena TaxID=291189 RepID=A0A8H2LF40_9FLAO|nr:hypothetical protein [Bizionia saleffrena]TYB80155.1 hypothetical protein ES676_00360 [Bizionia saleffrena]
MLKLYTDSDYLTERFRRQVFPLLFDLEFVPDPNLSAIYNIVTDIEDCDVVVIPIDYSVFVSHTDAFKRLTSLAERYQKPLWVYTGGDYGFSLDLPNAYVFRLGGFDSQLSPSTFIMPSFINDPYTTFLDTEFTPLVKTQRPRIGFVGHAQSGSTKLVKEFLVHLKKIVKYYRKDSFFDKQSFFPSSIKRALYLKGLHNDPFLDTHFILRTKYRAGAQNVNDKLNTSKAFYDNMFENAYTFCIRGSGNFSVRFYETLATGRIPILLNTDCRLPLKGVIDWQSHCLILEDSTLSSISEQIVDFHNSLSEQSFEMLQRENRILWSALLTRRGYFTAFHSHFKTLLKE